MSTVVVAVISAAAGSLCTGVVSYTGWRLRRPLERRDALIEKKLNDRWDASMAIRAALAEMDHAYDHIVHPRNHAPVDSDEPTFYRERANTHRQRARELGRKAIPLLGESVRNAVVQYTDLREGAIAAFDSGEMDPDDFDKGCLVNRGELDMAINEALKSLPRP